MRKESDWLGEVALPEDALFGIHAWRARQNFPGETLCHKEWYQAIGQVKLACYQTVLSFLAEAREQFPDRPLPESLPDVKVLESLCRAAEAVAEGRHYDQLIVPARQGGAGTSLNMNVNEILSNLAILGLGGQPGDYELVDPFHHANVFQSTNDVIPTALKVAAAGLLGRLEESVNRLRQGMEALESNHRHTLRMGSTEMQRAVPSSFGLLFGAYNEMLSRDWWRLSRCLERLKLVNLGGGAAGTGLAVPRYFIMEVLPRLQRLTGLPLTRSENLADATQNLDSLVEVHAMLKALAVNLEKMSGDLRLLGSDIPGRPELGLPAVQTGSSIMPGKINPVIPEFVIGQAHQVYANDMLVGQLAGQGSLDLNPYLPVIGHAFLDSIKWLRDACDSLSTFLIPGLQVHGQVSEKVLLNSPTITTALIPHIGYRGAARMAREMHEGGMDVFGANARLGLMPEEKLRECLRPENLLRLGYSLRDL
jgi:aspartate ammonia-lyase